MSDIRLAAIPPGRWGRQHLLDYVAAHRLPVYQGGRQRVEPELADTYMLAEAVKVHQGAS